MKKNHIIRFFTLTALLLSCAVSFGAPTALSVWSVSPKGQQYRLTNQAVAVHFNQPVAAVGEAEAFSSSNCPLVITPSVKGTCRYSDTQTVVFEPEKNWPVATRFTVTVKKGFTSAVSKQQLLQDYTFSFNSDVPQVYYFAPNNNEHWVNLTPTIYAYFSMQVDPARLASFVTLKEDNAKQSKVIPVTVRAVEKEEEVPFYHPKKEQLIAIHPQQKLEMGKKYTVVLSKGLPPAVWTANASKLLGMEKDYTSSFFTYPPLEVVGSEMNGCLPFTPLIKFSSPVRMRAVYQAAEVVPATAKRALSETEMNELGYESTDEKTGKRVFRLPVSFVDVKPHQSVTVTLKAGMQDIYGNKLAKDATFTLTNDGYCPNLSFSGGKGVLESYLKPVLPVEVMNMENVHLRGAVFNKDNFIAFEEKNKSYCKEVDLPEGFLAEDYSFKVQKDRSYNTGIDLSVFEPNARNSIVFSQVKNPLKKDACWISSTSNITDIGVTFKTSAKNNLVWTTSLKTGKPLAGLSVELRSENNKIVWSGKTDENGLARAPGWDELDVKHERWGHPKLYAFVTSEGGDAVISTDWDDGMELWRMNVDYSYSPQSNLQRGFLFTDRGIYRPGETVYIKGVLRTKENGRWQSGKITGGKLTISDSRGEDVFEKEITLSDMGTFAESFTTSAKSYTGDWQVEFTPQKQFQDDRQSYTARFQVESARAAEFDVHLRALKDNYVSNQNVEFSLSANYHAGGVLAGAPAKWKVRKSAAYFRSEKYNDYTFTPYFLQEDREEQEDDNLILSASGVLDEKGTLSFDLKAPTEDFPVDLYAEANVQSPSKQDLFSRTSVTVHPADFYIGAHVKTDSPKEGKPVEIDLLAVTPKGDTMPATVTAEIYRRQWNSVRKVGLSGRLEWVNFKQTFEVETQTLEVGKKGALLKFTPKKAGSYLVKLKSTDAAGRTVRGGETLYVNGKEDSWRKTDDDLLVLEANKKEYTAGQTARISVKSPYDKAQALVTVEREGILDAWVTEIEGGGSYVSVPIKDNYLPNVYVNVLLVKGRSDQPITEKVDLGKPQIKYGYTRLAVVPDDKRITTTITPNTKKYLPRQQVTLDITTKIKGKGVPAEVTVMAVDEGILALTKYKTPNLFDYFYGAIPLSVFTADNRVYLIEQRSFGEKGENRGGGGGSSLLLGGTDLRSKFLFTPYFKGNVKTDAKGTARVSFTLPDNLTTFRLMAVSLTQDAFGAAENSIRVSKPIMVTANVPQFARKGDTFKCGAVVHNNEDKKGVITVKMQTEGSVVAEENAEKTITVALGKTQEVTWNCRAEKEGTAEIAFEAKGKEHKDGVVQNITVSAVEKQQKLAVYSATKKKEDQILKEPLNLNTQADNRVELAMASTALINLKEASWYLMTYPYDCVEQQMSKVMPVILNEKLMETFGFGSVAQNRQKVQEILSNLPSYQQPSGGFGYWKDSLPDPYVTAYVLEVGHLAKNANYKVPQKEYEKAVTWLEGAFYDNARRAFSYSFSETDGAKAYITYVLALYGKDTHSTFNTLYAKRESLPIYAVSCLLKAAVILKENDTVKKELAQQLFNRMVYNPSSAYIDIRLNSSWLHVDNVTATARALDALVESRQTADIGFKMASWLNGQRNREGHWKNTSSNAAVLRALLSYYNTEESTSPNFDSSIAIKGQQVFAHHFEGLNTQEQTLSLPMKEVYASAKEVRVTAAKKGEGMLYYTLAQRYTPLSFSEPVSSGLKITRTVTTLDDKPVEELRAGERYKVTLTVTTNAPRSFVVAEDFIPAGCEIVNTSLATETGYSHENDSFMRSEKYTDRIAAFADYLPAGTHTYSYVIAAMVAGNYSYPAAWVSQMYEPEVFGRTATESAVVKP